jgi:DNA mismatch repair protein MutL
LEVDGGREFIAKISGYVSAPRERRTTRDSQYFFINGRFVRDKVIAKGLLEGYRAVLPHGVYPVAVLFLEIPSEEVDVNVHPAKTEVRFRRADAVRDVIAEAVRKALANNGLVELQSWEQAKFNQIGLVNSQVQNFNYEEPFQNVVKVEFNQPKIDFQVTNSELETAVSKLEETFEIPVENSNFERIVENRVVNFESRFQSPEETHISNQKSQIANYKELPPVDSALKATKSIEVDNLSKTGIRPVGQLHNSYIIAVDNEGLLLIDQHVAHERILFDKRLKIMIL